MATQSQNYLKYICLLVVPQLFLHLELPYAYKRKLKLSSKAHREAFLRKTSWSFPDSPAYFLTEPYCTPAVPTSSQFLVVPEDCFFTSCVCTCFFLSLSWTDYSLIDLMFCLYVSAGEGINGARFLWWSARFVEQKHVSLSYCHWQTHHLKQGDVKKKIDCSFSSIGWIAIYLFWDSAKFFCEAFYNVHCPQVEVATHVFVFPLSIMLYKEHNTVLGA